MEICPSPVLETKLNMDDFTKCKSDGIVMALQSHLLKEEEEEELVSDKTEQLATLKFELNGEPNAPTQVQIPSLGYGAPSGKRVGGNTRVGF